MYKLIKNALYLKNIINRYYFFKYNALDKILFFKIYDVFKTDVNSSIAPTRLTAPNNNTHPITIGIAIFLTSAFSLGAANKYFNPIIVITIINITYFFC